MPLNLNEISFIEFEGYFIYELYQHFQRVLLLIEFLIFINNLLTVRSEETYINRFLRMIKSNLNEITTEGWSLGVLVIIL